MNASQPVFAGRRNVLLLAFGQALMLSAIVMSMALGAVLGGALAPDRSLATLPIAVMVIGTAIALTTSAAAGSVTVGAVGPPPPPP